MAVEEFTQRLDSRTTRRIVVKTGAKLAYAAPLVAASFKLTSASVLAVSGFDCGTPSRCGAPSFGNCPGVCACVTDADGGEACVFAGVPPTGIVPCASGADCAAEQTCVPNTCFGTVCADPCLATAEGSGTGDSLF